MATITKQFTFAPDTDIVASEFNTNFDDIVAFLNNSVSHLDGSKAYTGWPSLPGSVPGGTLAPVPKQYVDEIPRCVGRTQVETSNGSGDIVVNHELGVTPGAVTVNTSTVGGPANSGRLVNPVITARNSTTFTVRLQDSTGAQAVFANLQVELSWIAVEADTASAWTSGNH